MVELTPLLRVTKTLTLLPSTATSESYWDFRLQTPVLVAETQAGTQAAPKYVDGNCGHKQSLHSFQGDEHERSFRS